MRNLLIILTVISWTYCFGQTTQYNDSLKRNELPLRVNGIKLDEFTTDTFYLNNFKATKIIAFKYNSVTFYIDYQDYLKSLTIYWKRYKEGMKGSKRAKARGEYINPEYEPRWLIIDSIYKMLNQFSKTEDTFYLNQKKFDKVGLKGLIDFDLLIEKGRCAIYNDKNIRQRIIIRQKGHWYRDHLAAWGGRRFFLSGELEYFYEATDWQA